MESLRVTPNLFPNTYIQILLSLALGGTFNSYVYTLQLPPFHAYYNIVQYIEYIKCCGCFKALGSSLG